eukprot:TRINITY_DN1835_c0_g2_i3.p3 TRINITY_DN1835_c0_g2~~TRINITY_DN1835_c0_g2_i3.p3  ORF type:complete len:103 (-),score=3.57 TRINITY_DN1835_c0_g2_i3:8-316(-)
MVAKEGFTIPNSSLLALPPWPPGSGTTFTPGGRCIFSGSVSPSLLGWYPCFALWLWLWLWLWPWLCLLLWSLCATLWLWWLRAITYRVNKTLLLGANKVQKL